MILLCILNQGEYVFLCNFVAFPIAWYCLNKMPKNLFRLLHGVGTVEEVVPLVVIVLTFG